MGAVMEMPKYQCHKKVWALKIKSVDVANESRPSGTSILTFENQAYAPKEVSHDFQAKHKPQAGGYYVVYEDGYQSFSPAEAFESGYTLI